jgi:hypothetical protein
LPGAQRFAVQADGALIPDSARLPRGKLPEVDWQPLSAWISLAPQPAAFAGELRRRAALRLVRTGQEESACVLLTPWAEWQAYALSASALRLRPLRFAVCDDGRTLLRGNPLPPLLGERYVEHGGIAVPCGWSLAPALDPPIIRELLGIPAADLALFKEDISWEWIRAERFVSATRSSVRATKETLPTSLQ